MDMLTSTVGACDTRCPFHQVLAESLKTGILILFFPSTIPSLVGKNESEERKMESTQLSTQSETFRPVLSLTAYLVPWNVHHYVAFAGG